MTLPIRLSKTMASKGASICCSFLAVGIWFGSLQSLDAAVIKAQSASRADVGAAVSLANDGDTVTIPAGLAIWKTTLSVTKNISLIGAGEGQTVITADLPISGAPPLISVSLTHESVAPDYSFRLSGLTLKSANITELATEHPYIKLVGQSNPAASPAPDVHGCVSRVRLDHMTWDRLNGLALIVDSCLGVADHITVDNGTRGSPPIKVFMTNWTPTLNPATGVALPKSYLAKNGFGSWADDPYWGTDKFWFFEDCNFTISNSTNACDNEQGARVVFRHCTFNGGGGLATHGMEGRARPGVKQHEVYNNYFIMNRGFGQHRSGSVLYFNNKSTAMPGWIPLKTYRLQAVYGQWGGASGDDRYDENPISTAPVASGTIWAVASPGSPSTASVTVGASDDLSAIDFSDGSMYTIQNTSTPFTLSATGGTGTANDLGWQYHQSGVARISGKTIYLTTGTTPDSARWQVGHTYKVRKILAAYGQPGHGKGDLLNVASGTAGAYNTFKYPATSGAKAVSPEAGYPLDPCYSWNNTDNTNGYYGFTGLYHLKPSRDYYNLAERTRETQNVGYPPVAYARATSNYPNIGPNQSGPYTPYTYPHPLAGGAPPPPTPTPSAPKAPSNLMVSPGQ